MALKVSERDILENFEENIGLLQHKDAIRDGGSPYILSPLLQSIRDKKSVEINYKNYSEQTAVRGIEPVGLCFMNNQWYLLAWCHLREDYPTFKLTCIVSASPTDNYFTRNHRPLKTLFNKMYGADIVHHISLKIEKKAMLLTGGSRYHRLVEKKECGEYYICRYATFSTELFARWFLSFADKAEIIEPIEIKEIVRELIVNIGQSYSK